MDAEKGGAMEAVWVINWLLDRRGEGRKNGGMYLGFVDLKEAFGSVDRQFLWRELARLGIDEGLRMAVKGLYRDLRVEIWVDGEERGGFYTRKGIRQGRPLSATLFNVYMASLEGWMKGRQVGGVRIGSMVVRTLFYVDDVVLLAGERKELREMLSEFVRWCQRRGLEVNVGKSKVLIGKKGRCKGKEAWHYRGEELEKARRIKYLSFWVARKGESSWHVRDRVQKARRIMGRVWGWRKENLGVTCGSGE